MGVKPMYCVFIQVGLIIKKLNSNLLGFHGFHVSDQGFSFWLLWNSGEDHFSAWNHLFWIGQVFVQVGIVENDSGVFVSIGVVIIFLSGLRPVKSKQVWSLFVWSAFIDGVALRTFLDEKFLSFSDQFSRHF